MVQPFTYGVQSQILISPLPQRFSLRHPRCDLSATLRSLSEQLFGFTMHYNRHRESTYVIVNRSKRQLWCSTKGRWDWPGRWWQVLTTMRGQALLILHMAVFLRRGTSQFASPGCAWYTIQVTEQANLWNLTWCTEHSNSLCFLCIRTD